jgi:hypothetical protein
LRSREADEEEEEEEEEKEIAIIEGKSTTSKKEVDYRGQKNRRTKS